MKRVLLAATLVSASSMAGAHSASDAYLTLAAEPGVIHGQWDIAIRDLDFVLKLDGDGDGKVTWGELKRRQSAIERYAYPKLTFAGESGNVCSIKPIRQWVDAHADGAYAALFFDVVCVRTPRSLTMDYTLFFAIDPSHRGIFVMHTGENTSTAVLAPDNTRIELAVSR